MTLRFIALAVVVTAVLCSVPDVSVGQQVSIGGGSGRTTGSSSTTSTGSSSSTGSRSTTGSSTTSNSTTSSVTSNTSSRTSAAGTSAAGTSATATDANGVATNVQNNAAQNFIGGNALDSFVGGGLESGANTNRNRQFRAVTETGTEGLSQRQQQQQQGPPRSRTVSLRVGFPVVSIMAAASQLSAENAVSLESFVSVRPEFSTVSASISADGRATLVGTTATSDSRRLAANLIRLQPGVRRVDNQIVVTGN